jgi:hypothetical protein
MRIPIHFFAGFLAVSARQLPLPDILGKLDDNYPKFTSDDPWHCLTENIPQYFQVPKPNGSLSDALASYASEIRPTCTYSGTSMLCPYANKSYWCDWATAVPSSLRSEYSSYGSVASSWWSVHSRKAFSIAADCPRNWYYDSRETLGAGWLNLTIINAECFVEAKATGTPMANDPSERRPLPTGSSQNSRTGVSTSVPQETKKSRASRLILVFENTDGWMIVGIGMISMVGAMNVMW